MYKVNDKLYNWASIIDPNALIQAETTSRLPFVERVALMPDAHVGMGATVGSVIGTNGAIIPAAVGVDIGCGMAAVHFDMKADQLPDNMDKFMPMVERAIPAGVGQGHAETSKQASAWLDANLPKFSTALDSRLKGKALEQFGSLGSGNHFFEVCLDENDEVWIVLHSGSRGLGNILGTTHINKAKKLAVEKGRGLEDKNLAYFMDTDDDFQMYIDDMLACQDYAAANRQQMLTRAVQAFREFISATPKMKERINCHHNFTQLETQPDGSSLWITRKGAIKAATGDLGIIPGSMGARSYIVEGLGNDDSFCSCSHGAGRVYSRSDAKKLFSADDLRAHMKGKAWNSDRASSLVDEIPDAYKPIDQVMADQADLVSTKYVLSQVFNYKG